MSTKVMADMVLETDPSLPAFFLGHLASLATRQAASASAKERAALSVAMFSTYLDCIDLGLGGEAQKIMGQLQHDSRAMDLVAA